MASYKIYLEGHGFLKTKITRKVRLFSKSHAERIARLEKKRGDWVVRIVKA